MSPKSVTIGNRRIGSGAPIFIIAEAGVNHNGNVGLAKQMIDAAKSAGADAIKFQTFNSEDLVIPDAPCARYQRTGARVVFQLDMIKKLQLKDADFEELSRYCDKKNIMFLSTPFDLQSVSLLESLDVPAFKIGSGDITNIPLILLAARKRKTIILSTGMATLSEIERAVSAVYSTGNRKVVLLHCTSSYPAEYKDVNLRAITIMQKLFFLPVGYSDHTLGIDIAVAAAAIGASVIEKHFTLDRNFRGPDHKASLEPDELRNMVVAIRNVQASLGDGIKRPMRSEFEIRKVARKSIVTARDIQKGDVVTFDMLAIKRPGTGMEPDLIGGVIGKKAKKNIRKDSLIKPDYFI